MKPTHHINSAPEFEDIQGLIRFAHGHLSESCLLLLDISDADAARAWLSHAPITSAAGADPKPQRALQVAFSANGLSALGLTDEVIGEFSAEFIAGMSSDPNRSRRLGDTGSNAPGEWAWGGSAATAPDLVLMLYAAPDSLDDWSARIQSGDFDSAFSIAATLKTDVRDTREHFGFVDGISQPTIDWQQRGSTDRHERDRYSNLAALGEFVLGYRNEYGLYTSRPLLDPQSDPRAQQLPLAEDEHELRDLGRNGTYLVIRQLSQDVAGFWQYVDSRADSNANLRERLAALMVGRERDGAPLVSRDWNPIDGIDADSERGRNNHFTFDNDPHGQRCPIGAHVRRSNPRTGDYPAGVRGLLSRLIRTFGFGRRHPHDDLVASTRFHRVLRRGRRYGPTISPQQALHANANTDERGLQFISLGANIASQFEFVQSAWSASSKFAGLSSESDPLLGNREPLIDGTSTDDFSIPQAQGPNRCLHSIPAFVAVRGGGYFFMPGIKALRYIAGQSSTSTNE